MSKGDRKANSFEQFAPSRLKLARSRRGVTKRKLAELAEISTRSLTAYESGNQQPTRETVDRLAKALDFPLEFFGAPDVEELPLESVSFRALSKITARQRDQALAASLIALDLAHWIERRFTLPEPNLPNLAVGGIERIEPETASEAVRSEWGLGERPIRNMIHLLESNGVRVFSLVEECEEVDAFSFWRRGRPYMFLNIMKSGERSRMDAAHELGHLCLHRGGDVPQGKKEEADAKLFATAFLMPRSSVLSKALRGGRVEALISAKRFWMVSVGALAYRMHDLGLLTDWQYRTCFIEISRLGYRRNEPNPIIRETSQILYKILSALRAEGITQGTIARSLGIPLSELNKLVFGLVPTGVEGGSRGPAGNRGKSHLRMVE